MIKLQRENTEGKLIDIHLDYDTKSTGDKNKNRQVGLHRTAKLLHSKGDDGVKGQPAESEKIHTSYISNKRFIAKIYK